MPLIIDTNNVLHTAGILPPDLAEFGADVAGLLRLLQQSRYRGERIELVCDGSPPPTSARIRGPGRAVVADDAADVETSRSVGSRLPDNVNIRYSGPCREADDVIAMLVRHSTAPRNLTVVSSDRAVLKVARRRKCRTLTSAEFLGHLAADSEATGHVARSSDRKPPGGLTPEQVETWSKIFGVDADAPPDSSHAIEGDATEPEVEGRSESHAPLLPHDIIREAEDLLKRGRVNQNNDR